MGDLYKKFNKFIKKTKKRCRTVNLEIYAMKSIDANEYLYHVDVKAGKRKFIWNFDKKAFPYPREELDKLYLKHRTILDALVIGEKLRNNGLETIINIRTPILWAVDVKPGKVAEKLREYNKKIDAIDDW